MAVDTPAKIAIIGAGPVGLEAALYARYLGYDVDLYEAGQVCESLREAAHVRSFETWRACTTSLGRASLANQSEQWRAPPDDALLTFGELAERYFLPLAGCDLLADCIQQKTTVLAVGREGLSRGDYLQDDRRIDVPFRLILGDADGRRAVHADVVFDCTGTESFLSAIGNGDLPTPGGWDGGAHVDVGLPDLLGKRRSEFVGKRVLVVGDRTTAARAIVDLMALAADDSQLRVTWITRRSIDDSNGAPVTESPDDPLPARAAVIQRANQLAAQLGGMLDVRSETNIESIERHGESGPIDVEFGGRHAGRETFDRIIAAVPSRPNVSLWSEMQLLVCPALEAPLPTADFLRRYGRTASPDARSRRPALAQALLNPEPDFYVLGSKSYGRRGDEFLIADGHEQIVALFTTIGDRESLDLYASRFATS